MTEQVQFGRTYFTVHFQSLNEWLTNFQLLFWALDWWCYIIVGRLSKTTLVGFLAITSVPVLEIRIRNWSAIFLNIGDFVDYWLPSNWKCTVNLADQNGFWLAKCWNWSENDQWPAAISTTGVHYRATHFCFAIPLLLYLYQCYHSAVLKWIAVISITIWIVVA